VSAGDIKSGGKADLIIGVPGLDVSAAKAIKEVGKVQLLIGAGL
jgi:hypothetical protein